jgi:hypothetical protein
MFSEPRRRAAYPSRTKRPTIYALQSGHTAQTFDLCVAESGTTGLSGPATRESAVMAVPVAEQSQRIAFASQFPCTGSPKGTRRSPEAPKAGSIDYVRRLQDDECCKSGRRLLCGRFHHAGPRKAGRARTERRHALDDIDAGCDERIHLPRIVGIDLSSPNRRSIRAAPLKSRTSTAKQSRGAYCVDGIEVAILQ